MSRDDHTTVPAESAEDIVKNYCSYISQSTSNRAKVCTLPPTLPPTLSDEMLAEVITVAIQPFQKGFQKNSQFNEQELFRLMAQCVNHPNASQKVLDTLRNAKNPSSLLSNAILYAFARHENYKFPAGLTDRELSNVLLSRDLSEIVEQKKEVNIDCSHTIRVSPEKQADTTQLATFYNQIATQCARHLNASNLTLAAMSTRNYNYLGAHYTLSKDDFLNLIKKVKKVDLTPKQTNVFTSTSPSSSSVLGDAIIFAAQMTHTDEYDESKKEENKKNDCMYPAGTHYRSIIGLNIQHYFPTLTEDDFNEVLFAIIKQAIQIEEHEITIQELTRSCLRQYFNTKPPGQLYASQRPSTFGEKKSAALRALDNTGVTQALQDHQNRDVHQKPYEMPFTTRFVGHAEKFSELLGERFDLSNFRVINHNDVVLILTNQLRRLTSSLLDPQKNALNQIIKHVKKLCDASDKENEKHLSRQRHSQENKDEDPRLVKAFLLAQVAAQVMQRVAEGERNDTVKKYINDQQTKKSFNPLTKHRTIHGKFFDVFGCETESVRCIRELKKAFSTTPLAQETQTPKL